MKENALYYYQNAVALKWVRCYMRKYTRLTRNDRPYDVRMLQGLAQCYENMGRSVPCSHYPVSDR